MTRIVASTAFVVLFGGVASAGSTTRYNEPPVAPTFENRSGHESIGARGKRSRRHKDDVTGSIPIAGAAQTVRDL